MYPIHCNLRVLFVVKSFPRQTQQYMNNQITGLLDENIYVRILAHEKSKELYKEIIEYKLLEKTYYNKLPTNERTFDILYCLFTSKAGPFIDYVDTLNIKGKLIVCFRGGDANQKIKDDPVYYQKIFKRADCILVVCNAFKESLIKYGCPAEKIVIHHSGINLDKITYKKRIAPKDGLIKILTVGRLIPMKGHKDALQAIKKVKSIYPNIRYEIIGDGPLYNALKKYIKQLGLKDHVTLRGYLPHEKVIQAMDESHIFFLASHVTSTDQEGIPNAIMEAAATGMPIVATNHSGIPELIQNTVSGYLVNEHDTTGMAEKIVYLINNPSLWNSMGKAGAEKVVTEHNKIILNKNLISLFKKLSNN